MKKLIIAILALCLIGITGTSQNISDFKDLHRQYIEYCNTKLKDTLIIQYSSFKFEDVPLYSDCGNGKKEVFGYKRIISDTIWSGVDTILYKDDYGQDIYTSLTLSPWRSSYSYYPETKLIITDVENCTPPTRKVKAILKQEKSSEEGFWHWIYNTIK